MGRMAIAYAVNDAYVKPLMATVISLFAYANKETIYDIYVINYKLKEENRELLREHIKKLNLESGFTFLDISDEDYQTIPIIYPWGKETNYRIFLPKLLPHLNRVLYLDTDTLVVDDLTHMQEINLTDYAFAGASTAYLAIESKYNRPRMLAELEGEKLQIDLDNWRYINAGVMYINLDYWRQYHFTERALNLFEKVKHLPGTHGLKGMLPDQDILNYLANVNGDFKIYCLPYVYNASGVASSLNKQGEPHFLNNEWAGGIRRVWIDYAVADRTLDFDRIKIIHMINDSPWVARCYHSAYRAYFKSYADRTSLQLPNKIDYYRAYLRIKFRNFTGRKDWVMMGLAGAAIFFMLGVIFTWIISSI